MDLTSVNVESTPRHEVRMEQKKIANPAPLGLYAFGLTTALLPGILMGLVEPESINIISGFGLFYGGLAQLLAGMWEMKNGNSFGATAFSSFGAFWMSLSVYNTMVAVGLFVPIFKGEQVLMALWGIFTFLMFVCSFATNVAVSSLLFALTVLFALLAATLEFLANEPLMMVTGAWGYLTSAIAFYAATAELLNITRGKVVLPLGTWLKIRED